LVNGVKNDIPSYRVKVGDTVNWKESVKLTDFYKERTQDIPKRPVPAWLILNQSDMSGTVQSLPADEDLQQGINSRLIVEFYSR
jgi:small subunit ribosomal protein S4